MSRSAINLTTEKTSRGFAYMSFSDVHGNSCSIQKSSLAELDCIWIGLNDANAQILARHAIRLGLKPEEGGDKDNGWVPYSIPEEVSLSTRMHLSREQVKALLPILRKFVKTGELE